MEAIKLCRLDTPIIFIEARINLSRFVVTGCAAKTSATRSEERFSRNAETDLVCRLLLEKKNSRHRGRRPEREECSPAGRGPRADGVRSRRAGRGGGCSDTASPCPRW